MSEEMMVHLDMKLTPTQLIAVGIALGGRRMDEGEPLNLATERTGDFGRFPHEVSFTQLETTDRDGNSVHTPVVTSSAAAVFHGDDDEPIVEPPGKPSLDTDGMPWDARIHASTRAVNADGRWKKRRGVDDVEVTRVEMEIGPRGQIMVPPPPPADTAATVSPVPPPPTTTNRSTVTDFVGLMGAVTTNHIDMGKLQAEVVAHGLNTIAELPARPDLINSIATALGV